MNIDEKTEFKLDFKNKYTFLIIRKTNKEILLILPRDWDYIRKTIRSEIIKGKKIINEQIEYQTDIEFKNVIFYGEPEFKPNTNKQDFYKYGYSPDLFTTRTIIVIRPKGSKSAIKILSERFIK